MSCLWHFLGLTFLLSVVYYVSAPQANLQLSWLRLFLYQCELSWSLLRHPGDPVDTPFRSNKGKLPGWQVFVFVVSVRHGDTDEDLTSFDGWWKSNLPLLR